MEQVNCMNPGKWVSMGMIALAVGVATAVVLRKRDQKQNELPITPAKWLEACDSVTTRLQEKLRSYQAAS